MNVFVELLLVLVEVEEEELSFSRIEDEVLFFDEMLDFNEI